MDSSFLEEQLKAFEKDWPCLCTNTYICHLHRDCNSEISLGAENRVEEQNFQLREEKNNEIFRRKGYEVYNQVEIDLLRESVNLHNFFKISKEIEIRIPIKLSKDTYCERRKLIEIESNTLIKDSVNSKIVYDIFTNNNIFGIITSVNNQRISNFQNVYFTVFNTLDYNLTLPKNFEIGFLILKEKYKFAIS